MELRHLRYFVAVAEEGNLRRAAAKLHIAPPPLSVQISQLEAEIGVELFARAGRGLRLTNVGSVFLEQARKALESAQSAVNAAQRAAKGEYGDITVGHIMPAGFLVYPKTVPMFRRLYPDIELTFRSVDYVRQIEELRREKLDIAFAWSSLASAEFDSYPLCSLPVVAILPHEHRLVERTEIYVSQLSDEPLVLSARELDPTSFLEIENIFQKANARMNIAYQLENAVSIVNFVAMGCGVGLLPSYIEKIPQEGVVYRNLRRPQMVKTLSIFKRKLANATTNTFFDYVVAAFGHGYPASS